MKPIQKAREWTMVDSLLLISAAALGATPAAGPRRVLSSNPRCFTDGSGRAVQSTL
jgi:hypothetical protein